MLDQVAQHGVREAVFVGPLGVAKDAVELVRIGSLDGAQGILQGAANIRGGLTHPAPMSLGWNLEAVVLWEEGELLILIGLGQPGPRLFVEHVAQALVEQQRKDKLLVVASIDGAAQERSGAPEVGFELLLGDTSAHASSLSRLRMAMSLSSAAKAAVALACRRRMASSTVTIS